MSFVFETVCGVLFPCFWLSLPMESIVLERLVSKMCCYVSSGTLNPTHSLTLIRRCTQCCEHCCWRCCRSPSPEPVYNHEGKRTNTREVRTRKKLENERHRLIQKMLLLNPQFRPPYDYRSVASIDFVRAAYQLDILITTSSMISHLKCSGVGRLHFEVFCAIQV